MGVYTEYLDRNLSFQQLTAERKRQLKEISKLRGGRDVLVFAADLNQHDAPISIGYPDLLPISDQIANLSGQALDLILESPGGSGEAAEDIIRILRSRYDDLAVIVPGWAKSAATIMTMAGNEILMGTSSALGPIDAQITWQGKVFSADALLEGMEKIKQEVTTSGALNKAYIPILQGISPGELQSAENALDFAKKLVTGWLATFKFQNWETHATSGKPVTDEEKSKRAEEIASTLCHHRRWLTHGRSITMRDLQDMGLRITDYSQSPELEEAIRRYYTLLEMTFAGTTVYKIFETPTSQIYRLKGAAPASGQLAQLAAKADHVTAETDCPKCRNKLKIQVNFKKGVGLETGALPFPANNKLKCPSCGVEVDVGDLRRQLELQFKKRVVT